MNSKYFRTDNFILQSGFAQTFYRQFVKNLPIIGYCNYLFVKQIVEDVNQGLISNDIEFLGNMVQNICGFNTKNCFGLT